MPTITSLISVIYSFIVAKKFKDLYLYKINRDIKKIRMSTNNEEEILEKIKKKGGVSNIALIIALVVYLVVFIITFKEEYLTKLGVFLAGLHNIAALDVLPYHDMAIPKYENLGIAYPLKGVPPLTHEQALEARNIIIDHTIPPMSVMKSNRPKKARPNAGRQGAKCYEQGIRWIYGYSCPFSLRAG